MRYKVIYGDQQYFCKDIDAANEIYMRYFITNNKLPLYIGDNKLNKKVCGRSN